MNPNFYLINQSISIVTNWQDTNQVILLSKCHGTEITSVKRKDKTDNRVDVPCPAAIAFYIETVSSVDLCIRYRSKILQMMKKSILSNDHDICEDVLMISAEDILIRGFVFFFRRSNRIGNGAYCCQTSSKQLVTDHQRKKKL